ncbi:hypothetical protein FO519_002793 [Halicephalobus sp. NKZ332]|nr:hypothetical protein FO519_002793 [Halicephalobus sp. NKZ332]
MTDGGSCTGFEPQNYLRDRCKKCFRLKSKHEEQNNNQSSPPGNAPQNGRPRRPVSVASAIGSPEASTTSKAKKEKRRSWRERNNPDEGPDNDIPDTSDTVSVFSFKSANSKGMSSAKSAESLTSTNDARSMVTAISGDSFEKDQDEDRALTPTESEFTNDHLRSEIRLLQEEVSKLKEERRRLTQTPCTNINGKEAPVVEQLQQRLIDAESLIQDYRDENTVLKCELRDVQAPPENSGLENKLKNTENLCDELMIENENLKSDVRDLQQEIEEMQDQYREEEIEEFRELQRELEQNAKNCRILQFKLRKAERQRDQSETEKEHFLQKLKEINISDPEKIEFRKEKELESELRIAKEVSVRLHNELENAEEKRCKLEDEVFYYKEKCRELQTQNKWREARTKSEQAAKRHSQELIEGVLLSQDEVHKELRDVLERENDLREQLKFTEEDLKRCRTKVKDLESENEELLQKLVNMTETVGRTSGGKRAPITRSTRMLEMEIELMKKLSEKKETGPQLNAEFEKDLSRMMSTIHELEKKNTELTLQLKKQENPPATIIAELATVKEELKNVKELMESQKNLNPQRERTKTREVVKEMTEGECTNCDQKSKEIEQQKEEIIFYKKKNKELTNQVLQTEDRWSREIEKQTHTLRTQIHSLDAKLAGIQSKFEEQNQLLNSTTNQLMEKKRTLEEEKEKNIRLQVELEDLQKELQQIEKDQHGLKEWEIKYKKLEKLFDQEKEKFDSDRTKIKNETSLLKKRTDEAVGDLEKLQNSHQRREIMWNEERQRLQKEMEELKAKLGEKSSKTKSGDKSSKNNPDEEEEEEEEGVPIPVQRINYRVIKAHGEGVPELQVRLSAIEKRNEELEKKVVDLRLQKEELESELTRRRISFEREKESMLHKVRQEGKIKIVEIDALQQKFASRMSIMENTNKSLHSQLVQARRERDHHREAISNYEKKIEEEQKNMLENNKKLQDLSSRTFAGEKRVQELEAEVHRLTVEVSLSKDAHKADKKLWKIEKSHFNKSETPSGNESGEERDRRITEDALKAAESVQKQYSEYQQLYSTEVSRLNSKIKELQNEIIHKQFETDKLIKEFQEQIKIMEIDQRNLIQAKEMQVNAREVLQADQERLLQIVQQSEIQKLTRKYKISAVVDNLKSIPEKSKNENEGVISTVIQQLNSIKEEDCRNAFTSNDVADFESPSMEFRNPSTDFSSSNLSIKSSPYQSQLAPKQKNQSSYSLVTPSQRSYSIDSNTPWDGKMVAYEINRARSPQRTTNYPDPPPSFILSKDRIPEYDKDGRLHYIPRSIARSASYDRYGTSALDSPSDFSGSTTQIQTKSTGTWTEDDPDVSIASKAGSTGTNILYKIRREELSKGTTPSVKSIAKAFESMDPRTFKRGLFSIRKSRSVDTSEQSKSSKNVRGDMLRPVMPLNRNTTSMSQIELGGNRPGLLNAPPIGPNMGTLTLPRGGRNPFKSMGARIVDRVRRSLSRSRKSSEEPKEREETQNPESTQPGPLMPTSPPPPMPPSYSGEQGTQKKAVAPTPVKTKKIVVKKKTTGSTPSS